MSTFTCDVVKLTISQHPNADAIELANVGLFQSIVRKNLFKTGDLAVYIPEGAIVPDQIMKECYAWDDEKNRGKLAGANYNRVKAIKLRGVLSQGLVWPLSKDFSEACEGDDLAEKLGIIKFNPNENMPAHFKNRVAGELQGYTVIFDVENLKKHPNSFSTKDRVVVTEKIHGASCLIGILPKELVEQKANPDNLYKGQVYISTKQQSKRGVIFSPNGDSVYTRALNLNTGFYDKMIDWFNTQRKAGLNINSLVIGGEVFGKGVQDLTYDQSVPVFRGFEAYWAIDNFIFTEIPEWDLNNLYSIFGIQRVPVLYSGLYNTDLLKLTDGMSTLAPSQIREGIVIRSENGDKRYKMVSEAYLLRKGNTTEYE